MLDPPRVVAEMHRVLVPDGLVYSEIPFIQQVHEGAHDFTRWTLLGHRRLLRDFDELRSGPVCGPAMALAWSFRYLAVAALGTSPARARVVARLAPLLTFWLPRLDRLLLARPGAGDAPRRRRSSAAAARPRRRTPRSSPATAASTACRGAAHEAGGGLGGGAGRDAEPRASAQEAGAPGDVHGREHERDRQRVARRRAAQLARAGCGDRARVERDPRAGGAAQGPRRDRRSRPADQQRGRQQRATAAGSPDGAGSS